MLQRSSMAVLPQNHSPRSSRAGSGTSSLGTQGSGADTVVVGEQQPGDAAGVQPRGRVGHRDRPVAGVGIDEQAREETRHRPGVADQPPSTALDHPQPEAVVRGGRHGRGRPRAGWPPPARRGGRTRGTPPTGRGRAPCSTPGRPAPSRRCPGAARASASRRSGRRCSPARAAAAGWYVVRDIPSGARTSVATHVPPGPAARPWRRPRRGGRSRGCCSGRSHRARPPRPSRRCGRRASAKSTPGERSHHDPTGSLCMPEVWESRARMVDEA